MSSVIIAVDLAKLVFEVAVSTGAGRVTERKRLSRPQFERFWRDRLPCRVVMEACASSHYWGRRLRLLGFEVVLLPPHYVRPYVRRNKTDRTDCEALLEALRCAGIHPCGFRIFWPRRFRKLWHQGRGFVAGEFLLFLKVPGSIAGTA